MRKIISILALLSLFGMNAVAFGEFDNIELDNITEITSDISIVDIFCDGSKLDIYMMLSENMQSDMQTKQFSLYSTIPGVVPMLNPAQDKHGKVSQGLTPTYTILLLDISLSMAPFRDDAVEYISQIMGDAHSQAHFLLASFGIDFNMLVDENAGSNETILEILKDLEFNDSQTNLYKAMVDAIDYAEKLRENIGALVNVLVITDGIDASVKTVSETDVIKKLEDSKIIVHTMQISKNIQEEYTDKLRNFADISGGFFIIYISGRERTVANEFNDYLKNIYFVSFNIASLNIDIAAQQLRGSICFTVGAGREPNYYRQIFTVGADSGEIEGAAPPNGEAPAVPVTGEAPDSGGESVNPVEGEEGQTEDAENEDGKTGEERSESQTGESRTKNIPLIVFISGGVLVAGIMAAIAIIIYRQSGKTPGATKDGIYMKLDIISGQCRTKTRELYLKKDLFIGKNPKCDIIFIDSEVSDINSRIFLSDNMIYIEDLGSVNGTSISGMKIFAKNRLRGGDIISIGNVSFSLKF